MFWAFILFTVLALLFIKLGAVSVWVAVFSTGLKFALLVIAGLSSVLIWRRFFGKK